jgi:FMN-dependent NADH-azoreductase
VRAEGLAMGEAPKATALAAARADIRAATSEAANQQAAALAA